MVVVTAAGALLYGVDVPTNTMPAFIVTLIVGAATFCALGLAIVTVIPNADASPAVVNASILPLLFVSDVFIPLDDAPGWLTTFADIFPVRHFSLALQTSFNPFETGAGFQWVHLLVMAVWTVVGLLVAARFYFVGAAAVGCHGRWLAASRGQDRNNELGRLGDVRKV